MDVRLLFIAAYFIVASFVCAYFCVFIANDNNRKFLIFFSIIAIVLGALVLSHHMYFLNPL